MKSPHALLNILKKANFANINLGCTFVEDLRYNDPDRFLKGRMKQLTALEHLDQYSNFYFPFDRVTLLTIVPSSDSNDENFLNVTFKDNPEHKTTSPIEFSTYDISNHIVISGEIQLAPTEDAREIALALAKKHPEDPVTDMVIPTFDCDDNQVKTINHSKWSVVIRFRRSLVKHKNKLITIDKNSDPKVRKMLIPVYSMIMKNVISALIYFTGFLARTDCFVVEELTTTTHKGKTKVKPGSSLFHIIDIKTLRKQYISREKNHCPGTRAGHERRRHTRTFRSDFYTHKKGETIVIPPTWVGPTEAYNKETSRLYKVRLDIG